MAVVIREARAGELDAVARLLVAAFAEVLPAVEGYLEAVAGTRSPLDGLETLVADEAGVIVGAGTLDRPGAAGGPRSPWPRAWARLRVLGVDPDHRRRGIARMLAQARIERARALEAPVIGLHTAAGFFPAAREMYRRMGWLRARAYDYCPVPGVYAEAYIFPLDARP